MKLASVSGNWKLHPNIKVVAFEETDCCYSSDKFIVPDVTDYRCKRSKLQQIMHSKSELEGSSDSTEFIQIYAKPRKEYNMRYGDSCTFTERQQIIVTNEAGFSSSFPPSPSFFGSW